jgi:uncharacterized protein
LIPNSNRSWPVPRRPWALRMSWIDLAFLHWPVSPELLRPLIPDSLALDTFKGEAWIGVVPFEMANVRARLAPPIPTAANFAELNVRTYVRLDDRAGIWFMSLDAASWLAVMGARITCHLPYFHAEMRMSRTGEVVNYLSERDHRGAAKAAFKGRYMPIGPVTESVVGSLESWLTDRYCLFTAGCRGQIYQLDVHHPSWPLQLATVEIEENTMAAAFGIPLPRDPPLVHYSARLDVVGWLPVISASA